MATDSPPATWVLRKCGYCGKKHMMPDHLPFMGLAWLDFMEEECEKWLK